MNYNYWKPVFCGILLTAVISAKARPAENHIESLESDRTEGVQIIEHKTSDDDAPIKSLPFYGGAKGKYLLIHPSGRTSITNRNPSFFGLKGEEDGDEDVGMEEEGLDENESSANGNSSSSGSGNPDESVCVGSPPDNASVAEAKPVGLAVAGPGGVAASKPVGTAISGPGGLSVARPVATAIAGVPGAEGLVGLGPANKKKYERPLKTTIPAVTPVNKTKEERSFVVGRRDRNNDDVELEYSNSIPAHHKLFYIPVYLPDNYNPQ